MMQGMMVNVMVIVILTSKVYLSIIYSLVG